MEHSNRDAYRVDARFSFSRVRRCECRNAASVRVVRIDVSRRDCAELAWLARLMMVEQLASRGGTTCPPVPYLSFSRHDHRSASQFGNLVIYIVDWHRIRELGSIVDRRRVRYRDIRVEKSRNISGRVEWQLQAGTGMRSGHRCYVWVAISSSMSRIAGNDRMIR